MKRIVLPLMFLTVALAGSLRPAATLLMRPPSLFALVLATLLLGALVQSGAFDPRRVIHPARSVLANSNGIAILGSLSLQARKSSRSSHPNPVFHEWSSVCIFWR